MKMQYKLVVFDWDGTLVDSVERIVSCLKHASQEVGLPLLSDSEYCDVIGLGMSEAIKQLYPTFSASNICRFMDAYRHEFFNRYQGPPPLFDGVSDVLASLREEGYLLAVATGKSRKGLAGELDVRDIADFFLATRCADETRSKPDPMMLYQLMGELRCDAADVLMIGDSVYDMEMAANAGVDRLAVTWGVHGRDRLVSFKPVRVTDRVSEIEEFLLSS